MDNEKAGDGVVMQASGAPTDGPLGEALAARADVLAMTEDVHDAALTPNDPGGLSHGTRAALAVRVSVIHGAAALAEHYGAMLAAEAPDAAVATLADPAVVPAEPRLAALAHYTDRVAREPKAATAEDIKVLQAAGVADDDIVRLAELNAFLAYQIRLVAGLELIRGAA